MLPPDRYLTDESIAKLCATPLHTFNFGMISDVLLNLRETRDRLGAAIEALRPFASTATSWESVRDTFMLSAVGDAFDMKPGEDFPVAALRNAARLVAEHNARAVTHKQPAGASP